MPRMRESAQRAGALDSGAALAQNPASTSRRCRHELDFGHGGRARRRLRRLAALGESPHAFGSTLAEEAARPDDAWAARLAAPALGDYRHAWPYVAELDGTAVGLAWVKLDAPDAATASLYQVWVAPQARGQGIGAALLDAAIAWARARRAAALHLGVTAGDGAAARLYRRAGFVDVGAPEPRAGTDLFEQAMVLALGD